MATWVQDIEQALANLEGVAKLSDIYAEVKRIRPAPHPQSIDAIIRGTIESHSSDSAKFNGNDIFFSAGGLGNGVWGLRSFVPESPVAADLGEEEGNYDPERTKQETYRILRDTSLARQIKALHKNSCQICGESIALLDGGAYSEAHFRLPFERLEPYDGKLSRTVLRGKGVVTPLTYPVRNEYRLATDESMMYYHTGGDKKWQHQKLQLQSMTTC